MSLITTVEHAFAVAAQKIVAEAKTITEKVIPVLQKVEGSEAQVEAVTALVSPQAVNIERTAYAVLGKVIAALSDASTAANAGGLNVSLDAALIADIKAILPALQESVNKPK